MGQQLEDLALHNQVALLLQLGGKQLQELNRVDPLLVINSNLYNLKHGFFFYLALRRVVCVRLKLPDDESAESLEMLTEPQLNIGNQGLRFVPEIVALDLVARVFHVQEELK